MMMDYEEASVVALSLELSGMVWYNRMRSSEVSFGAVWRQRCARRVAGCFESRADLDCLSFESTSPTPPWTLADTHSSSHFAPYFPHIQAALTYPCFSARADRAVFDSYFLL